MGTVTATVIVRHIHMPSYREQSGRELLCILHEDWPGAQGVDCVRQAIVIRCQKVGIRAAGHKKHRSEREDRTEAQARTRTLPESSAKWEGQR